MWKKYVPYPIRGLFTDFKERLPAFLKYQVFTKILLAILIFPIFRFLVSLIMQQAGYNTISNMEILQFGFSKSGLLLFVLLYITATCIVLLEFGGLLILNHHFLTTTEKKKLRIGSIFVVVLKKLPKFIGVGGVLSVLFLFIFFGFAGVNIFKRLGFLIKIPPFIMSYIDENQLYKSLYIIVIVVLFTFTILWIFSLHFILLENKRGLEALKASSALVRNNVKVFLAYLLTGLLVLGFIGYSIYFIWSGLIQGIDTLIHTNHLNRIVTVFFYILSETGLFLVGFIIMPLVVYYSTNLFYLLLGKVPTHIPLRLREDKFEQFFRHRKNRHIVFYSIVVLFIVSTTLIMRNINNMRFDTEITAHKGNVTIGVENTLEAVMVAMHQKADYVEIDVQESKDGLLFLAHDTNLKRLTGYNVNTRDLTYSEIKELDLAYFKNGTYIGRTMPLLEDIIKLVQDNPIKMNIEVKPNTTRESIVSKLIPLLKKYDFEERCVITSLDYEVLQEVKRLNPLIQVGYAMYLFKGSMEELHVDFIGLEESLLTQEILNRAHRLGLEVHVWTVNKPDQLLRFIKMGVDNIITDNVIGARDILEEIKEDQYKTLFKKKQ